MKRKARTWKRILACVCAIALLGGTASAVEGAAADSVVSGVTRGAFIQALYRAHVANGGAAVESAGNPTPFSDVGVWSSYFEALCWAKGAGIAGGYAGGTFRPEQTVTREQAAVMLYRYGKAADRPLQPASAQALTGYADAAAIPPWSREAVAWAVGNGLWYSGSATLLKCSGTVTKNELTALMDQLYRGGIYPAFTVVSTKPELTMTVQESTAKGAAVVLTNASEQDAVYGEDYGLLRRINGGWYQFSGEMDVIAVGHELPAGESQTVTLSWESWPWGGSLSTGTYRIVKSVTLGEENITLGADFTVS